MIGRDKSNRSDVLLSEWEMVPLRFLARTRAGGTPTSTSDEYWDEDNGVPWLTIADMSAADTGATHTGRFLTASGAAASRLTPSRDECVLFAMYASVGQVAHLRYPAVWNQAILGLEPRPDHMSPRFLYWALKALNRTLPYFFRSNTQDNLNAEQVKGFRIPRPPLRTQRAIAEFLDRETAQIDAFIAKNEQLIALLTERRAAAVDELLRSSWSGAEALKVGWFFTFHNGDRGASYPSRDEFVEDGVPFVNAGHLRNGTVDYHEMNYVTEEKFNEMGGAKLQPGDLLFCLRGSVGKLGLFRGDSSGSLASSLVALRSRNRGSAHERYFLHLLQCSEARDAIDLAQTGSAQPNLSVEQLAQLRLPVPDVHVQRRTADRIERVAAVIDDAMHAADRAVMLAAERRAALISAAVTGKIDVGVNA